MFLFCSRENRSRLSSTRELQSQEGTKLSRYWGVNFPVGNNSLLQPNWNISRKTLQTSPVTPDTQSGSNRAGNCSTPLIGLSVQRAGVPKRAWLQKKRKRSLCQASKQGLLSTKKNATFPCAPGCSSQHLPVIFFFSPRDFLRRLISVPHFIIMQESALDFLFKCNTNSYVTNCVLGCVSPTF